MKYAEIAFLPFYDGALQFHIRRCARGSGRSRFRLLRAFFDRNTICPRYCIPATLLRQYDKMRGLFFVFRGRTTPDPTKTRPSNATDTRGVLFFHFIRQRPTPAPARHSIRREAKCPPAGAFRRSVTRVHRGEVGACTRSSAIPSDARRNACLQEHFDEAANEPRRGEVPTGEKCLRAGAFRRCGAQAPTGRSTDIGEMPACRSISTMRRTSPIGAKSAKRSPPPSDPCKEIPHIRSG